MKLLYTLFSDALDMVGIGVMLMRLQMKMTQSQSAGMKAVFAVAFLIALPLYVGAAKPAAEQQRWIDKNGVLKCIDADGKVQFTFKKGIPTYESEIAPIPANYRSVTFLVLDKGKSAVVFDYNNGGTTVTFYSRGCSPSQVHSYPDLELFVYTHELKSGLGLLATLATVNKTFEEDFVGSGYFVLWDSSGSEKMKVGPIPIMGENIYVTMYQEEGYGVYGVQGGRGGRSIYFDFSRGKHYDYTAPHDMRAGKSDISPDGLLRIYQLLGRKTPDGRFFSIEEFQSLPRPEFERVAKIGEPQYRLIHEHQF